MLNILFSAKVQRKIRPTTTRYNRQSTVDASTCRLHGNNINIKLNKTNQKYISQNNTINKDRKALYLSDCVPNCLKCDSERRCIDCKQNYFKYNEGCAPECNTGYFIDETNAPAYKCAQCHESCADCIFESDHCTSCKSGMKLYQKNCISQCPSGHFDSDGFCTECDSNCAECEGTANTCTKCYDSMKLDSNTCVNQCRSGMFDNNGRCEYCDESCMECESNAQKCTVCKSKSKVLYNNECINECPYRTFEYIIDRHLSRICIECNNECAECALRKDFCTRCRFRKKAYQGDCVDACPSGYYDNNGACTIIDDKTESSTAHISKKPRRKLKLFNFIYSFHYIRSIYIFRMTLSIQNQPF